MLGRRLMRGAAAASMISTARTNRAVRKNIEQQNEAAQNQQVAQEPMQTESQALPKSDLTIKLEQLNDLKNQGILSQEEFDAKKKQMLGI